MKPFAPSLLVACLVAVGAGAIAALGFEPWNLWPLTILAVAVLFALIDGASSRWRAALIAWAFGTGHFTVGLGWIATAFTFQAKMPAALGWVTVVLLAMFLALYPALAAGLARLFTRRPLPRVLAFAAFWMLAEWLRGWVLSGFAWNPLGAAWLHAPAIAQLASLVGALGLSALVVFAGGGLWLAQIGSNRRTGLLLLAIVGASALAAAALPEPGAANGASVLLVQPNIGQDVKYEPGVQDAHLRKYHDLTVSALTRAGPARAPAIILWSESSVPYLVEEEPQVRAFLASALGPGDLLLFGGVAATRDPAGNVLSLTNSLFVLDAQGTLHARYDKAHLVPLGEYVPARSLMTALGVARLAPGDLDFQPGPGPKTLQLPGFLPVGVQICYEIIFPGQVVDAANRPGWIANISNDAWFGPTGPPQHLAQARLRAIEEGLPIARATPTGISAMIDAKGRVTGTISAGVAAALPVPLPPALPPTLFARFGHLLPALLGLFLLGLALWLDRRKTPQLI